MWINCNLKVYLAPIGDVMHVIISREMQVNSFPHSRPGICCYALTGTVSAFRHFAKQNPHVLASLDLALQLNIVYCARLCLISLDSLLHHKLSYISPLFHHSRGVFPTQFDTENPMVQLNHIFQILVDCFMSMYPIRFLGLCTVFSPFCAQYTAENQDSGRRDSAEQELFLAIFLMDWSRILNLTAPSICAR